MTNYSAVNRDPATELFEGHLRAAIPDHVGRYIEGEPMVFHELISDYLHLDVYCWAPSARRNMWTMVTVGMAGHAMNVPASLAEYQHAELVLTLPGDWPSLDKIQAMPRSKAHKFFWPIAAMKDLARLPYLHNTWIGLGHSTQAGRGHRDTYTGSNFSGMLVAPVNSMPQEVMTLDVHGTLVNLHGLYPLYAEELQFMLDRPMSGGAHDMYHQFLAADLHEGVFPDRTILV